MTCSTPSYDDLFEALIFLFFFCFCSLRVGVLVRARRRAPRPGVVRLRRRGSHPNLRPERPPQRPKERSRGWSEPDTGRDVEPGVRQGGGAGLTVFVCSVPRCVLTVSV